VEALLAALRDESGSVRGSAAVALGRLGYASPQVVEALLAALGDESEQMRAGAALALAELKAASEPVIGAVRRALERADSEAYFLVGYRWTSEQDALFEALWRLEEVRAGLAADRGAS